MEPKTKRIRESRLIKQPDGYSVIIETRVLDVPEGLPLSHLCEVVGSEVETHNWQPEAASMSAPEAK